MQSKKVTDIQQSLSEQGLDGWLFYDFRRNNSLACDFLEIPKEQMLTRRFFYWVPREGMAIKIVSAIEADVLKGLSGETRTYRTWTELESSLEKILKKAKKIAMEYSPRNAIPYLSKVDAGTMDLVRGFGIEVVSSANLLQKYNVWNSSKLEAHLFAADLLSSTVDKTWQFIAGELTNKKNITEYDVQQYILAEFKKNDSLTEGDPICAVNENSANPHYTPSKKGSKTIKLGDFILLDLWCKQKNSHAVYADISRVGIAASQPSQKQEEIFRLVKKARDAAIVLVEQRFRESKPIQGWEVDQTCRDIIEEAGYGPFFIHRTGHNIDELDHGSGTHMDNYETHDSREIIPQTCFSIEPGIYLPGEFGIRLEYNVYIHADGRAQITGGIQENITCLFPEN